MLRRRFILHTQKGYRMADYTNSEKPVMLPAYADAHRFYSQRYPFKWIFAHNMFAFLHQQLHSSGSFHTVTHNSDRSKCTSANERTVLCLVESLRMHKLPCNEDMRPASHVEVVNSNTSFHMSLLHFYYFYFYVYVQQVINIFLLFCALSLWFISTKYEMKLWNKHTWNTHAVSMPSTMSISHFRPGIPVRFQVV